MKRALLLISAMLSATLIGFFYTIPYHVEVLEVNCHEETRLPIGYSLTVALVVRNNAPLSVRVKAVLVLRCTLMDGSKETYSYPFDRLTVEPYSTGVLKTTVSFGFTTPENPKAIYTYSADLVVVVEGPISTRTVEITSIKTIGGR